MVCCYHFVWEVFGVRFPELRNPATASILNGHLCVAAFFVLSGFVLTAGHWGKTDKAPIKRRLVKRYFRLTIPILASTALVVVLMRFGLTGSLTEASIAVHRESWLGSFLRFDPDPLGALGYSLLGAYWLPTAATWNAFLWPMPVEMWGSYAMLLACLFVRNERVATGLLALLAVALLATGQFAFAAAFPIGCLLAIAHQNGALRAPQGWMGPCIVVALIALASIWQDDQRGIWVIVIIAGSIVWLTVANDRLRSALSGPVSQFLGRVSFPLYLVQFAVIVSLTPLLIVVADRGGFLSLPVALCIATASLAAAFVLAVPFLWVERLTAIVGRTVSGASRAV